MDTFSYVNIFATKGIEYLLVISFMVAFFVFVRQLARPSSVLATAEGVQGVLAARGQLGPLADGGGQDEVGTIRIRPGSFLAPGHTSSRLRDDGSLEIGIGALARHLLGEIDHIEVVENQEVRAGDVLAVLHLDGRRLHLRAPADGTISEVRQDLGEHRDLSGAEATEQSWLVRMEPSKLSHALANMHFAADAKSWLDGELVRMRDMLAASTGPLGELQQTMADGGAPVRGLARKLPIDEWEAFEQSFFGTKD